jgi:hypothetical protein
MITKPCIRCGEEQKVEVPEEGYLRWTRGQDTIENAMPQVSADDREILLSAMCPHCWARFRRKPEK